MNKKEFLKELDIKLSVLDYEVKKDILYDYEEHFRIALFESKTEEEICADLGNPQEIAETYLTENFNVSPEQINSVKTFAEPIASNSQYQSIFSQKTPDGFTNDKIMGISMRDISYDRMTIQETDDDQISVKFSHDGENHFYSEQRGDILHIRKNQNNDDESGIINIFIPKKKILVSLVILDCKGNTLLKNVQINRCEISVEESNITFDGAIINDASIISNDGNTKMSNSHIDNLKFESSDGNFEMKSSNSNSISVDTSDGEIRLTSVTASHLTVDSSDGNINVSSCSIPEISLDSSDGDCNVSSCTVTNLNIDTSDGNVCISNSNMNKVDIDTSDGDVNLSSINVPAINIDSSDGNISLSDIVGNYIEIDTSDGDIHITKCTSNKCKMDSSGGNISAVLCNLDDLTIDSSDGDINLNLGDVNSLKCENSDGNVKVNIMNSYNSVEIENSDGDIVLNIPWEISFSGHIEVDDGDFNTKLPLIYNKGDIKYSSQRQKDSRIVINNSDGNIQIGYSNKKKEKDSGFDFSGITESMDNMAKQFDNMSSENFFPKEILDKIVEPFKNFGANFKMPPIPPIPPIPNININIPSFYDNHNNNQNNYTILKYGAKEWIKNPDLTDNAVSITKVTSPDGVGIQYAYRLGDDKQNIGEIVYNASDLEKNKHYMLTFWIKEDESQIKSSNKILQAEIIMDGDYENRDIFELSLITPTNIKNNWKLYELPFEVIEHEIVQFKISVKGNVTFFTN